MDRFTNGELDALIRAVDSIKCGYIGGMLPPHYFHLNSGLEKLKKQREAQK